MAEARGDKHWRKKPVVIEAVQWDESMTTLLALRAKGLRWVSHDGHVEHPDLCRNLRIRTLEDRDDGAHHVSPGDWIIKGVAGEFYACKPDIFAATYEPAFTRSHEQVFVVDDGHVGIAAVRKLLESDTHEQPIDVIGGTPHERAAVAALSTTPQKPVAFVPLHPRNGPLWANTVPSLDADRPAHYEVMPLYTAPPTGSGEPVAWRWRRADDQPWINSSKPPSFDTPEALACWTIQPLYVASATPQKVFQAAMAWYDGNAPWLTADLFSACRDYRRENNRADGGKQT